MLSRWKQDVLSRLRSARPAPSPETSRRPADSAYYADPDWIETQKSEARFQTVFENAPFMINSFDKTGKAILWNRSCVENLGWTQEELNEQDEPLAVFYPDPQVLEVVLQSVRHPDGKFREFTVRRKDGARRYQMWANFRLPDQSLIAVGYDVTILRESEEKLRTINANLEDMVQARTKQLDEERARMVFASKFAALGEMAGGVAHEINNPLAVIDGFAGQLEELLDKEPLDKKLFREMISRIRSSSTRITKIVSGLRSISRDGSADPLAEVEISRVVDEVMSFCQARFWSAGISLVLDGTDQAFRIRCRQVEIEQVLLNLLNNAYDAVQSLPDKGVRLRVEKSGSQLLVSVTDSGPGLEENVREKVFQPFFTLKPIGKGTGLGLSISRAIVNRHGGSLMVDGASPHTRFVIELPLAD